MKAESTSRWRRLSLLLPGFLFEIFLCVVLILQPPPSGLVHLYNFALIMHVPFFWLVAWLNSDSAFAIGFEIILVLACWSVLWATVFHFLARFWKSLKTRFLVTRKQRMTFNVGLSVAVAALVCLVAVSAWPARATPFTTTRETEILAQNNTAFALDLYQRLKERPGNLFFSPYSVSTSLAMTSIGARGQTEMEMTNALHFQLPPEQLHHAFGALTGRMTQVERWNRIVLKTANGLWAQSGHPFRADFLTTAQADYDAEIRQGDFRDSKKISAEINDWISRQTNGKIKDAISSGHLDAQTRLVLCNAIYFKGKWKSQFKQRETKPRPFRLNKTNSVEVPMMNQQAEFKLSYSDDSALAMLELPYAGGDLSMVILLPTTDWPASENDELSRVERDLTAENLQSWLAQLDRATVGKVNVSLPRFTFAQSYDLKNALKSMGMISAFTSDADFSGINGTNNLFISDVFHQSFVNVDEAGTEAAAMTIEFVKAKGMNDHFVADHPFLFLIRDKGAGSILFIGRVTDPRS